MGRRFRRRPPPAVVVAFFLFLLLVVRVWQHVADLGREPGTAESLTEGVYRVQRIVDGDTLIVAQEVTRRTGRQLTTNRQPARVRLLGIDAPETVKPNYPVEPWGPEATRFTEAFVAGGQVRLRFDKRRKDRFDRFLAYVYVDQHMLNEELVRAGLARVSYYQGDSATIALALERAEQEAKRAKRGMWADEGGNL